MAKNTERNAKYTKPINGGSTIGVVNEDYTKTIRLSFSSKVIFDTKFFSFKEIEEMNTRLQEIGIEVLFTDQNEKSWCDVADLNNKRQDIEKIYHEIALGIEGMPDNLRVGEGVIFQEAEILGEIAVNLLEGNPECKHFGAFGLTDASIFPDGRPNLKPSLNTTYFHYYRGSAMPENSVLYKDLEEHETFDKRRKRVTTTRWMRNPQTFYLRITSKGVFFTYRHIRNIEKKPGFFVPMYEIQTHYANRVGDTIRINSTPPATRVENLLRIFNEFQEQGFGHVNEKALQDIVTISKADLGITLDMGRERPIYQNRGPRSPQQNSFRKPTYPTQSPKAQPKTEEAEEPQESFSISEAVEAKSAESTITTKKSSKSKPVPAGEIVDTKSAETATA